MQINSIIVFFNRVYYSAYRICRFIEHRIFDSIVVSLLKPWLLLPIVRKNLRERYGWNSYKECVKGAYKMSEDSSSGMIMHNTNALMCLICTFPLIIVMNILVIVIGNELKELYHNHLLLLYIFSLLLFLLFAYNVFWKKDRYLYYFSQFEKEEHQNQKVWDIMTALYSIMVAVVWFVTLINK